MRLLLDAVASTLLLVVVAITTTAIMTGPVFFGVIAAPPKESAIRVFAELSAALLGAALFTLAHRLGWFNPTVSGLIALIGVASVGGLAVLGLATANSGDSSWLTVLLSCAIWIICSLILLQSGRKSSTTQR